MLMTSVHNIASMCAGQFRDPVTVRNLWHNSGIRVRGENAHHSDRIYDSIKKKFLVNTGSLSPAFPPPPAYDTR